ncbi:MAG: mechanosensitive ion channel [Candidatus Andersenbacteria bacterium]
MQTTELLKSTYQGYLDTFLATVPALSAALVIVALFTVIVGIISLVSRRRRSTRRGQLIGRIAQVIVISVGGILALGMLGVNLTALVAGLGLLSVGFSFALQDLLVNFLAGLEVLGHSSFELGDILDVDGAEGTVRRIGGRAVKLETDTGEFVYIPNRDFLLKPVRVYKVPHGEYLVLRLEIDPKHIERLKREVGQRLGRLPSISPAGIELYLTKLTKQTAYIRVRCRLERGHPPRATLHARGLELLADLVGSA